MLELLTDYFLRKWNVWSESIALVNKRHAQANNPYVLRCDHSKPKPSIPYIATYNLYGWAMRELLLACS